MILFAAPASNAQTEQASEDSLVTVHTKDGQSYEGDLIADDQESVTIRTPSGVIIQIRRDLITAMDWSRRGDREYLLWRNDPNYSRLLFAPTGRPLRRGHGYFSDHYIFLLGIAGGITNQIGVLAGMSIIPGVGLDEQMLYIAPKIGHQFSETFAASIGTLYFNVSDVSAGLLWGVATFGKVEASLTTGIGFGYVKESDDADFDVSNEPVILVGGSVRISNHSSLVSENWLISNLEMSEMPFSLAIRFFGEHLTADFGFILIGEVLQEGLPIPWLSISYNWH